MNKHRVSKSIAWRITDLVTRFVETSPLNSLRDEDQEKAWGVPIVGFSCGDDCLYDFYKKDIGDFYSTPVEFFERYFPESAVEASELTVISWVLPQTETTRREHREHTRLPTERWVRSRLYGEQFNDGLRGHIVSELIRMGHESLAPVLSSNWTRHESEKYNYASNWSERHAAYASGLGTFGLCDGLITPLGKAMRCGSVIAHIKIPPTPRPYDDHHAYCLFFMRGTCGLCIDRCPAGAISERGHDKTICSDYCNWVRRYNRTEFGLDMYGCGLCQTAVPCEAGIPQTLQPDRSL